MIYEVQLGEATHRVELEKAAGGQWQIQLDGKPLAADVAVVDGHTISLLLAGRSWTVSWDRQEKTAAGEQIAVAAGASEALPEVRDPRRLIAQSRPELEGRARMKAPMAGKVVRLLATVGDAVEAGQGVLVLEAMKMQNEVRSPKSGTLVACAVAAGDTVATGQLLAEVD